MSPGINFKFPLRSYNNGYFEQNQTTLEAVKEDIKTLLLTKKGERLIHADLGTNISIFEGALWEQFNRQELETRLTSEIQDALEKWMPFVTLQSLQVNTRDDDPNLDYNEFVVLMNYILTDASAAQDSIQIRITT